MSLKLFEFNEETINYFRDSRFIPLNFFNKNGQILIHQKFNATDHEINSLLKFRNQGIYYDEVDESKLSKSRRIIPDGLTDTKLLSTETSEILIHSLSDIFSQLKTSSLNTLSVKKIKNTVNDVFTKFENQSDAMTGLVNILELMKDSNISFEMQIAIKRSVTAMALKTRGMTHQSSKDREFMQRSMNNLMISALLCDISYIKMKVPEKSPISVTEREYIKNHPLVSYLMIAHEDSIDPIVKRNILLHHRPAISDSTSNNFPSRSILIQKLASLYQEYIKVSEKRNVANSIAHTINDLKQEIKYDEDVNILAIASEFASLTTDVPWRASIPPVKAVRMLINNSYFTYHSRAIREFLDQVSISLCDNKMILNEGDFVIIALESMSGQPHFEICKIIEVNRFQSKPTVVRIGTVNLDIQKDPKIQLTGFDKDKVILDKRQAKYHLENDLSRRMIFVIDEEMNPELYNFLKSQS